MIAWLKSCFPLPPLFVGPCVDEDRVDSIRARYLMEPEKSNNDAAGVPAEIAKAAARYGFTVSGALPDWGPNGRFRALYLCPPGEDSPRLTVERYGRSRPLTFYGFHMRGGIGNVTHPDPEAALRAFMMLFGYELLPDLKPETDEQLIAYFKSKAGEPQVEGFGVLYWPGEAWHDPDPETPIDKRWHPDFVSTGELEEGQNLWMSAKSCYALITQEGLEKEEEDYDDGEK